MPARVDEWASSVRECPTKCLKISCSHLHMPRVVSSLERNQLPEEIHVDNLHFRFDLFIERERESAVPFHPSECRDFIS
jgi:hypothetical protein